MYIEFFGLPGSGKSHLAKELIGANTVLYRSARAAHLWRGIYFAFLHPHMTMYWLVLIVREARKTGTETLIRFKCSLLFRTFSHVQYARSSTNYTIADEGMIQRILSVFETKQTPDTLREALRWCILGDIVVDVVGTGPHFGRYHRGGTDRARLGNEYLERWKEVQQHNYMTLIPILATVGVPMRHYRAGSDTSEHLTETFSL